MAVRAEFTRVTTDREEITPDGGQKILRCTTIYYEDGGIHEVPSVVIYSTPFAEALIAARETASRQVEAIRDAKIAAGAPTPSGVVDSDEQSIRNILGRSIMAAAALASGAPFLKTFRLRDNTEIEVNAEQMLAIGVAAGEFVDAVYRRSWTLKAQIEAAGSVAAVKAVPVEDGWPAA